jgi:hypothetical protein
MSAAASGTKLQTKLTTETHTAGFFATAIRSASIAVSALSTFFALDTSALAMYAISAPGAFAKASLIAFLSTAAPAEAIAPPKKTATAAPTTIRVFIFIFFLTLKIFYCQRRVQFQQESSACQLEKVNFFCEKTSRKTANLPSFFEKTPYNAGRVTN